MVQADKKESGTCLGVALSKSGGNVRVFALRTRCHPETWMELRWYRESIVLLKKKDDFFYGEGDANESRRSTTMRGIRIALNKKKEKRKKRLKNMTSKFLKMGLTAAMAMGVVGCSSSAPAEETEDQTVITIGISPDYEPYESLNTDNEMVGFDIDMVAWFEDYLNENEESEEKKKMYDLWKKKMDADIKKMK